MRHRLDEDQLQRLQDAIDDVLDAGWDRPLDCIWDLREKIQEMERLSNNTADQHDFLFNQQRESATLINYLLIAMRRSLMKRTDGRG